MPDTLNDFRVFACWLEAFSRDDDYDVNRQHLHASCRWLEHNYVQLKEIGATLNNFIILHFYNLFIK